MHSVESRCPLYRVVDKRLDMIEGVSKLKNSEKRQIVGAAGIPARSTASSRNLLRILLQCRRQELKVSGAKRKANARGFYSLPCYILH